MALPSSVEINFVDAGDMAIRRGSRGVVYLLLQNSGILGDGEAVKSFDVFNVTDIPQELSVDNKKQVEMALRGSYNTPSKVVLLVQAVTEPFKVTVAGNEAFAIIENSDCDYLAIPGISEVDATAVATWAKTHNESKPMHKFKVVLPNTKGNTEWVVDNTTEVMRDRDKKEYTATQSCARVAGMRAGCPMRQSLDRYTMTDMEYAKPVTRAEAKTRTENGEFFVALDRGGVRVVADVNSLTTLTDTKDETYQQNKEMDIMDALYNALMPTLFDKYIGKVTASYQGKLMLVNAIDVLLKGFEREGLIEQNDSFVALDVDAQRAHLEDIGYRPMSNKMISEMTDDEVLKANTKGHVFLKMRFLPLGAIRHIEILVMT